MKWPKGVAGIVLALVLGALVCVALWFGIRAIGGDGRTTVDGLPGLPGGSQPGTAVPSAGETGSIGATPTQRTTGTTGGTSTSGAPAGPDPGTTKTAFTETDARAFVERFFDLLRRGDVEGARAMTTQAFADSAGPVMFDRRSDPLGDAEVIMAALDGNRWVVYCGEDWRSGPRQTRYRIAEYGGKMYIDSIETADLP